MRAEETIYRAPSGSTSQQAFQQPSVHSSSSLSHHVTTIPMSSLNKKLPKHGVLPPPVDFAEVSPSARLQFRALARKALSYHRRQMKTNLCCLVIWPVFFVLLCLVFSMIGREQKIDKSFDLHYCVNEADPLNDIMFDPLDPTDSMLSGRYLKTDGNKIHVGWMPTVLYDRYPDVLPCVRWFGDHIPIKKPYENSSFPLQPEPHAHYTPSPVGTWFKLRQFDVDQPLQPMNGSTPSRRPRAVALITGSKSFKAIRQKVYVSFAAQIKDAVGQFPSVTRNFTTPPSAVWPPTDASIIYATPNNTASSLLGNIPVRYADYEYIDWTGSNKNRSELPSAEYWTSEFIFQADSASMDATILDMTKKIINGYGYYDRSGSQSDYSERARGDPFGGLTIESLDMDQLRLKMTMQMAMTATRGRQTYSHDSTPAGLRQMITMSQMTTSMMKHRFGSNFTITQGVRILPYVWNARSVPNDVLSQLSAAFFPFALGFLLPTFVSLLVQEKEDRHRMMMAMNGLRSFAYYLGHYVEFMCMSLITCLFFALAATGIRSDFAWRTPPALLVIIFLIWSHTQVTFAFFFASLFSRARKASLMVYFFVAISCIMGVVTDFIFKDGIPTAWSIHPMFAFFRVIRLGVIHASLINGMYPLSLQDLAPGNPVFTSLMIMLGESVVFLLLTGYFDAVLPSEYGVVRPWHFPITTWFKSSSPPTTQDPESLATADHAKLTKHCSQDSNHVLVGANADVYAERDRVESGLYRPDETPLILHNLFHQYPNKAEPALRGVSFGVPKNQVLGLLGPNGAGKSTMIHLLTGLYTPTSGTAFVAGSNIRTDMTTVHSCIGVCPQHDILWNDLTIADHLLFYARLRGISPSQERKAVDYALDGVSLTALRNRQVVGLSGGERRRVSIAIALLGDNKVIFLDEPSTGLDPEVRRVIWDVVHRIKKGRTVILTTHSMEEADMLSDRICIMTMGRLRCIGSSLHLKEQYGAGFRLNIFSKPGRLEEACQSIEEQLMVGKEYRRVDKFTNASTFEFQLSRSSTNGSLPSSSTTGGSREELGELSLLFHYLNQPMMFPAVEDWAISQATLEDVFIKVVTEGEDAIAMPGVAQYAA